MIDVPSGGKDLVDREVIQLDIRDYMCFHKLHILILLGHAFKRTVMCLPRATSSRPSLERTSKAKISAVPGNTNE